MKTKCIGVSRALILAALSAQLIVNSGCQESVPLTYTVGGDVFGVDGASGPVSLGLNAESEVLDVNAEGGYIFSTPLSDGDPYEVLVTAEPTDHTCTITPNNIGIIAASNVIDVDVTCTLDLYAIGGSIVGLPAGETVTLFNSDTGELLPVTATNFTFVNQQENGTPYTISVDTNSATRICSVTGGGSGFVIGEDVSNIVITCEYTNWLTGASCNGTDLGGGCTTTETGYHYRGSFNGYACWWHTKNQAWNDSTVSNYHNLALYSGFDPMIGLMSYCHAFDDTPAPPAGYNTGFSTNYFLSDNVGAWGWCDGGAPMQSGGFVCFPE